MAKRANPTGKNLIDFLDDPVTKPKPSSDPFADGPAGAQGPRDNTPTRTIKNSLISKREAAGGSGSSGGDVAPDRLSGRSSLSGRNFGDPGAPVPGEDNDFGQFNAWKTEIAKRNTGR